MFRSGEAEWGTSTREWGAGWRRGFSFRYVDGSVSTETGFSDTGPGRPVEGHPGVFRVRSHVLVDFSSGPPPVGEIEICRPDAIASLTKEDGEAMGDDVRYCAALMRLDLTGSRQISNNSLENRGKLPMEFLEGLGRERVVASPIEALLLSKNQLRCKGITLLAPFLKSLTTLKELHLENNGIADKGVASLMEALPPSVEKLYLNDNSILDSGVRDLLKTEKARRLVVLGLEGNTYKRRVGLRSIKEFMERKDTAMKCLGLDCKDIEFCKRLLEAIPKESKIERLTGYVGTCSDKSTNILAPALRDAVLDLSSFDSICRSNHRLVCIGHNTIRLTTVPGRWPGLNEALDINRCGGTLGRKMRIKLRDFYFRGNEFDVTPFWDMDVHLMPYLLELVTLTHHCVVETSADFLEDKKTWHEVQSRDLGKVFRLVRNVNLVELFSFPSAVKKLQDALADNAALSQTNARLVDDNVFLIARNESLKQENDQLRLEIAELRARVPGVSNKRARTDGA